MLKINVNNNRAVEIVSLQEKGCIYIMHKDNKNNIDKWQKIQHGDIITLLNIYTYATEKGYTIDTIASDLLDKIDELERINISIKALNDLTEQMKEEERNKK